MAVPPFHGGRTSPRAPGGRQVVGDKQIPV